MAFADNNNAPHDETRSSSAVSVEEAAPPASESTEHQNFARQSEPRPAAPSPTSGRAPKGRDKNDNMEDFATALETFEAAQTEAMAQEDTLLKGTVVKLTASNVVVDIGGKSEGMVPLADVLDPQGNPRF